MASVKTYKLPHGEVIEVKGRYRTITVQSIGDGCGYKLEQFAHIDDSGTRKIRSWGHQPDMVAAVEMAIRHTDRLHG